MAEPKIESISELSNYFIEDGSTDVYYVDLRVDTPGIKFKNEFNPEKKDLLIDFNNQKYCTYFIGKWESKILSILEKYKEDDIRKNVEVKSILVKNLYISNNSNPNSTWFTFAKGLWHKKEDLENNKDLFKIFCLEDIIKDLGVNNPEKKWRYVKQGHIGFPTNLFRECKNTSILRMEAEDYLDGQITSVWDRDEVDVDDLERWDDEAQKRADEDPSDDPKLGKF